MTPAWLVVAVALSGAPKKVPFSTPQEIIKRIEASPTKFKVNAIETLAVGRGRLAEETWKQEFPEIGLPRVTMSNGHRKLEVWPAPSAAAQKAMNDAEVAFGAKDYATAVGAYRSALALAPKYYIASAYIGDALLFGEPPDLEGALAAYNKAISINPDDGRLYFFRATALRKLGKPDEAASDLIHSIALRPRNESELRALRSGPNPLIHVEPEILVPRAFVRRDGKDVEIYVDADRPEWFAWANCKALWLDDAAYRKERTGSDKVTFSMQEERECLANLLSVYVSRRGQKDGVDDDRLNRLEAIANEHLLDGLIIYELASRVNPHVVLTLSDEERSHVREYVEKYVLTRPTK